ncbi:MULTISPECIES: DUF6541 family protein [unclassified Arthrobacter]|uniref:DUF6541 family protein n=1 Tax=unclassified Arthrobacter TaxID=235627 RepID=UPI001F18DB09|nr:DUF6541 family protein [Arthrobacter sp. FW305-BF8]UKA52950.1 hypothetical protein LFT45_14530 [Arthrobacter sp. FW305-BF8]
MTWWETFPTFAATILVYFLPGLLILAAAGVRGLSLAALSAPVSASVAGSVAVILPYLRLPFNPAVYFIVSALAAAAILAARGLLQRRRSLTGAGKKWRLDASESLPATSLGIRLTQFLIPLAVLFPAIIIAARYISGFGSPESFSESFDNIYHLNAVRHIAETQNGSTLTLGNLTDASQALYPAAMHDAMALVVMLGAPSVMVAVNVGTIVTGAIVWPLSCIFLISRVAGYRPAPLLAAGVLSAGFSAFPYLMVAYGVLYPNHAAIALLPAVLGLAIEALGMSRASHGVTDKNWIPATLALAATLPGLALSHPSAAVALLAFAGPAVIAACIKSWQANSGDSDHRAARRWVIFATGYVLLTLVVWVAIRPSLASSGWLAFQSNARAIGEILGSAPMGTTTAWVLLVLTVIGLYVIVRHLQRMWWIAGMYLVGALLYLVASSWIDGDFRNFLTGVWYRDSNRLAALLPTVTLPVVVIGSEWIILRVRHVVGSLARADSSRSRGQRILSRLVKRLPGNPGVAATCVVLLALGAGVQGGSLYAVQDRLATVFSTTENSKPLTRNQVDLFSELANIVPSTDVIVANPRTGASLAYAFSGRRVLAPHIFGTRTEQEQLLLDHWAEASYNPRVCPAIRDLKAYWALDFGAQEIFTPRGETLLGLRDLVDDSAPGVELVKAVGDARLFRVTACG